MDSKGVGGTLDGSDNDQAVTTAWAPFTAYDTSVDTKGIADSIAGGTFTIGSGADGVYTVDATISASFPGTGLIEIALTLNGGLTTFRTAVDILQANKFHQFAVTGTGTLAVGDVIGLGIKGSANATGTFKSAQFRAVRIGG